MPSLHVPPQHGRGFSHAQCGTAARPKAHLRAWLLLLDLLRYRAPMGPHGIASPEALPPPGCTPPSLPCSATLALPAGANAPGARAQHALACSSGCGSAVRVQGGPSLSGRLAGDMPHHAAICSIVYTGGRQAVGPALLMVRAKCFRAVTGCRRLKCLPATSNHAYGGAAYTCVHICMFCAVQHMRMHYMRRLG